MKEKTKSLLSALYSNTEIELTKTIIKKEKEIKKLKKQIKKQKWHLVEEKLPKTSGWYLVSLCEGESGNFTFVDFFQAEDNYEHCKWSKYGSFVDAWAKMPIPYED